MLVESLLAFLDSLAGHLQVRIHFLDPLGMESAGAVVACFFHLLDEVGHPCTSLSGGSLSKKVLHFVSHRGMHFLEYGSRAISNHGVCGVKKRLFHLSLKITHQFPEGPIG